MFRLLFLFALAVFLASSFGTSLKKSANKVSKSPNKQKTCEVACGKDGKDGKDGRNGKDGRDGLHGKDGRDGRDAVNGAKGEKGEPGARGPDFGSKGQKGEPGKDGNVRAKGEKGSIGVKGSQGEKGEPGQKGMPGTCDPKTSSANKSACCAGDCSSGFHFFEKIQDLPTRGAADVEHFSFDGKVFLAFANNHGDIKQRRTTSEIYKMDELTGKFNSYQTLQTTGAHATKYFSIADKHFLAVANRYGAFGSWRRGSVTIYRWKGNRFVVFQKLSSKGASSLSFFTINGEKYLAVANYFDGSTVSIKSVIYKWSRGKFNTFQEIATEGAYGCAVFSIKNDTFIAFANNYNSQQKHSVQSTVFKWSGGRFVKFQSLQTYGARDVKYFKVNRHSFLAYANHQSGSKQNIDSFIYKWNGNTFVLFQSIPTLGALAWHPFVISGQTFLGMAHFTHSQSIVFQAAGARFVKYQEIPTKGGHYMTSFEYKGHTFLAIANFYNGQKYNINSALYEWV